jgi:hypothetical protein
MPNRITGSRLPLVALCRAAFTSLAVWPPSPHGKPAAFGSAVHKAVECWYERSEVDLDAIAAQYGLDTEEAVRLERVFDGWSSSRYADLSGAVAEWAGAFDTATGGVVVLPRGKGRDAYNGLPDSAVPATLDLIRADGMTRTGEVHDWKTGRTKLPPANENWQLRFGALLVARAYGLATVRVFLHTLDEEGEIRTSEGELDELDFDLVESQVTAWVREAAGEPPVRPGDHCVAMYCPMRATCSATQEAERSLAPVPEDEPVVYDLTGEITSHEQARWILHRIDAVQSAVDLATKMVRKYADEAGGIPTGDGLNWGCFRDEWTECDLSKMGEQGQAVLRMFDLDRAVESKLPTARVKAALKARGLRGKGLEQEYSSIMATLEGAGLTKARKRSVYTARKGTPVNPADAEGGEE